MNDTSREALARAADAILADRPGLRARFQREVIELGDPTVAAGAIHFELIYPHTARGAIESLDERAERLVAQWRAEHEGDALESARRETTHSADVCMSPAPAPSPSPAERGAKESPEERGERLLRLAEAGKTYTEIGKAEGVSRQAITKAIDKARERRSALASQDPATWMARQLSK